MKKFLAMLLALMMVLSLVACGGGDDAGSDAGTDAGADAGTDAEGGSGDEGGEVDYAATSLAVILAGSINDNGWNAAAYGAMTAIQEKYGCETAYAENVAPSDVEEFLRGYATQGFKMIIVHGSQYIDYVHNVAPEFPDSKFVITFGDEDRSLDPNVACVGPIESGFLTGVIAANITETGKVAFLGGEENPSITPIVDRFEDGVAFVNPDIEVVTGYIGSLTDADKAKEVAANVISSGVDVIGASANAAGLGVIQAAKEAGIYSIGFNSDQYEQAPDNVVVSVLRDFNTMFENVFVKVADGSFEPTLYQYSVGTGTVLSDWHGWDAKLPAEAVEAIESFVAGCADGSIVLE